MEEHTAYRVGADSDLYGDNCIDGRACAEAVREELAAYATERGMNVTVEIVDDEMSFGTRNEGNADVIEELDTIREMMWTG